MYQTTKMFGEYVQKDSRTFKARIAYGNTTIESIKNFKITGGAEAADDFSLGSAVSQYVTVTLFDLQQEIEGHEFRLDIGMNVNGTMEYVPMGLFTAEKPKKTETQVEVTAYDRMLKTERPFTMDGSSTTTIEILKKIQTITGVPVLTDGLNAKKISVPKGYSCREVLQYIAQIYGKNAICSRNGRIELHGYEKSSYLAGPRRYWGSFTHNEFPYSIEKLICYTGTDEEGKSVSISAGTGGRAIAFSNPFMSQEFLNQIFASLKDFTYMPGSVKMLGDPRLDAWDIITVVDLNGKKYSVPLMKIEREYDGGLTDSIEAVGLSEQETNAEYKGPKTQEAERYYAQLVMIDQAMVNKLDVDTAKITYATIENLKGTEGRFDKLVADNINATNAKFEELGTQYANIDFSNIGKAAIEQFYSTSGIIRDLVIGDQTITGELVGVTIKGDLIEGNTIVADKLVIKGSDGLYYKLNTNGESVEAKQTEYNSIHGSVIQAKTITATKIDVKDLVAFGATIGGFHITEDSLYSGVKNSVDNTTRGIYLDSKGQLSLGDKANYLKYYKNQNGEYQLAISAKSISFGVSGSSDPDPDEPEDGDNLVDVINGIQNDINKVRQEITTSLSIESSRGNIFKNDTQAMVLTSVIYHGTERITSISRLKTVFGNSTVSIRWSMQKFNETSFTVISANDSRIGSDGFTFSLAPDDIKNKVTLKCEFILNSLIKASDQITVIDVTDAYSVVLTSETYTFIGGTSGVAAGQSCSTEVAAYCGQNQCSKVSVTQSAIVCPIGISATVTNNNTSLVKITFKTTATISSACEATIPIVVDGITIYKKFSFAVAKAGAVGPKGDQGVAGKDGKDGATTYFHVKYSAVSNPTSSSQIGETPNTYIGTYVDFISEDSNDPKKYKWYRFQGLQGKQGEKGIPGENGANGETSYLHIKYSDDGGKTFTSKNGETMGAYIGTYVDFEVDDPTTVKSYSWARIRGDQGPQGLQGIQGEQGKQGIQGEPGKDGKTTYFHIKYSSVANPTASSQMSEIADTYIGTYTDFTEADSTDPKKYTWHRLEGIQGEQGKQGIQGSTGADGKTSYLHIKYSNDAGKTFTGNEGEDSGEYIGTCVDFNKNDPTTVTAYKWSKMKGEVGATGAAGKDGIVISITGSNGFTFKNSRGSTALTAHVFKGGVEQEITDGGICGSLGIIRWYVGTSTTAKATARSITVTADDITNIGSYTCQLE